MLRHLLEWQWIKRNSNRYGLRFLRIVVAQYSNQARAELAEAEEKILDLNTNLGRLKHDLARTTKKLNDATTAREAAEAAASEFSIERLTA